MEEPVDAWEVIRGWVRRYTRIKLSQVMLEVDFDNRRELLAAST